MRTHRIFTPESLAPGTEVTLGEGTAHYLSRVLRLAQGTEVVLFNGDGHDYRCRLEAFDRGKVTARVLERRENHADSPLRITLWQAVSRGERMDYCLQKATELGVAAVQLLLSERVEVRLDGKRLEKRLAHWRGVMQSASEQCGRATVPELRAPVSLDGWLAAEGLRIALDAGAGQALAGLAVDQAAGIGIGIGPEGGFSEAELKRMEQAGVVAASLGPRVLRTETAGPAAIAVLQARYGDFR